MDILVIVLQLLLSLSILVVTHEAGHFAFAKLFKIRVEKFYLFFDPWFSLLKFKRGETEYGVGWLPLGGYVKIAGMVDESLDTEQLRRPAEPWEFRSKPAWQRLLVMLGGVLVNLLTAPLIFWVLAFTYGDTYMPLSEARYGFDFGEAMRSAGFRDGDLIVGAGGSAAETYKDVANAIIFDEGCVVDLVRGDSAMSITMPSEFFRAVLKGDGDQALFSFRTPVVVDSVLPGSPASECGLARGDSVVSIAGVRGPSFRQFTACLDSLRGREASLVVARAGGGVDTLTASVSADGRLGFMLCAPSRWFTPRTRHYGLLEALPAGVARGGELLVNYVRQLPMIFTREGATKVGGFGTIAKMFPERWNWQSFWFNTAFLAIILAVMNILPIPALDGGHVMFLLVEVLTGRKVSDRVMEVAQTVGMLLLLALVVYANGADIFRALSGVAGALVLTM